MEMVFLMLQYILLSTRSNTTLGYWYFKIKLNVKLSAIDIKRHIFLATNEIALLNVGRYFYLAIQFKENSV